MMDDSPQGYSHDDDHESSVKMDENFLNGSKIHDFMRASSYKCQWWATTHETHIK